MSPLHHRHTHSHLEATFTCYVFGRCSKAIEPDSNPFGHEKHMLSNATLAGPELRIKPWSQELWSWNVTHEQLFINFWSINTENKLFSPLIHLRLLFYFSNLLLSTQSEFKLIDTNYKRQLTFRQEVILRWHYFIFICLEKNYTP